MRPLLTIPQWRESSSTLLLTGDSGCSNSLCSLNDLMIKELVSSWLAEMNILALYLAFSDTTLARVLECLITELQEWTSGSPLYFAGMNVPMFFVCGLLLQYSSCLKVFCFSRLPSNPITFLVLWPEREAFFGRFFSWFIPTDIFKLLASSAPNLGYMRQNKIMRNPFLWSQGPYWFAFCPTLRALLWLFYIWHSWVLVVLISGNREKWTYSIFQEA